MASTYRKLYQSRRDAIRRCTDKKSKYYSSYGGRGIKVCDRWLESFGNFLEDMQPTFRNGLSLDRINNEGNYEPSNCRWATRTEQQNNTRRNTFFNINGKTQTLSQWVAELGLKGSTVRQRYYVYGWPIEKSLGLRG